MKRNILQIVFLGAFFLTLLFVPGYWISLGGKYTEQSYLEGRRLSALPSLSYKDFKLAVKRVLQGKVKEAGELFFDQFIDRSFQMKFENAAPEQFPYRIQAIRAAKSLERGMIDLAYLFLDDPAVPAGAQSNLYVMRDSSSLISPVRSFSPATRINLNKRIKNYAELIRLYPNQNFYLFYFQRLLDAPVHPLLKYSYNPDAGKSYQYFKANKPEGLIMGDLMLSGMDDHIKYFFRTDHHWNIRGACHAYQEIYKMLAARNPAMGPVLKCEGFKTVPGVRFLGSLARSTLYPIQPEGFEVANLTLPPYRVISNGRVTYYDKGTQDLPENDSGDPYEDLYGLYFGKGTPLKEYIVENGIHRNALILGNSFIKPLESYLSSHYHHTVFINMGVNNKYSLGDILQKYQIDDIIIIGDLDLALSDEDWIINK
jgi:hypothetical protein